AGKQITGEACVHHLVFCDDDYAAKGTLIKCNPSIKTAADRDALRKAMASGRIDIIGTDNAPHLLAEKDNSDFDAPAARPLLQSALVAMLEQITAGRLPR